MQAFSLKSFKAFKEDVLLPLEGKNIIFYGENGAGKSSIYEALQLAFYEDKVKKSVLKDSGAITPEDRDAYWNNHLDSLKNSPERHDYEIKINGTDYSTLPQEQRDNYDVFMVSNADIHIDSNISIDRLLTSAYFPSDSKVFMSDAESMELFTSNINKALKDNFRENIEVEFDAQNGYKCKVKDAARAIEGVEALPVLFNEAKLHLIVLLVYFSVIQSYPVRANHRRVLILDDIITSLDAANRSFLLRYLCTNFGNSYQKVIFTHNISYFNLWMYGVNNIYTQEKENWLFYNIMESKEGHCVYDIKPSEKIEDLRNALNQPNADLASIGNKVRKRFEQTVHELSKILLIGNRDDCSDILDKLVRSESKLYLHLSRNGNKTIYNLLEDIETLLGSPYSTKQTIKNKIEEYKSKDQLKELIPYIRDLRLFQKVTLHPSSHANIGHPLVSKTEIEASLELLGLFEGKLKKLVDANVYSV